MSELESSRYSVLLFHRCGPVEGFAHARDEVREKKRADSVIQSGSTSRGQCSCAQVVQVQQLPSAAISFVHLIFNIPAFEMCREYWCFNYFCKCCV